MTFGLDTDKTKCQPQDAGLPLPNYTQKLFQACIFHLYWKITCYPYFDMLLLNFYLAWCYALKNGTTFPMLQKPALQFFQPPDFAKIMFVTFDDIN